METPSDSQRDLLRQIVENAHDLRAVLEAQFAHCSIEAEEHCGECFLVAVIDDAPLLPPGTPRPLSFTAQVKGKSAFGGSVQVLLWHENGRSEAVEISGVLDPHPAVADLNILERSTESDLRY